MLDYDTIVPSPAQFVPSDIVVILLVAYDSKLSYRLSYMYGFTTPLSFQPMPLSRIVIEPIAYDSKESKEEVVSLETKIAEGSRAKLMFRDIVML